MSQRNLTLYGARTRETPEDVIERDIRREIRVVLPRVFGGLFPMLSPCMFVTDIASQATPKQPWNRQQL